MGHYLNQISGGKKIYIAGHPCGGTTFAAGALQSVGVDVKHEILGVDGISSWQWMPKLKDVPYGQGYVDDDYYVIHLIRDPIISLASIVRENSIKKSFDFRIKYIRTDNSSPANQAACSYLDWHNLIIDNGVDETVKVEQFSEWLSGKTGEDVDLSKIRKNSRTNRQGTDHIHSLSHEMKMELRSFGSRYGYQG